MQQNNYYSNSNHAVEWIMIGLHYAVHTQMHIPMYHNARVI